MKELRKAWMMEAAKGGKAATESLADYIERVLTIKS